MTAFTIDICQLARHLDGEVTGRNSIVAPGPGHSRKDRSLSVTLDRDAPDGFLVNSFAGDDPITCRDHVRAAARPSLPGLRAAKIKAITGSETNPRTVSRKSAALKTIRYLPFAKPPCKIVYI